MSERTDIDWQSARAAIARGVKRLEHPELSDVERQRILRERAQNLARPLATPEANASGDQIMIFVVGEERVALPLAAVRELVTHPVIAPVPGAAEAVAGVMQIRGEIRPVFDLDVMLRTGSGGARNVVALARYRNREIGLRVDSVEDIRALPAGSLSHERPDDPRIQAVTRDFVQILNLDALLDEHWNETGGA